MTNENLKIIATIRKSLRRNIPTSMLRKRKRNETKGINVNDVIPDIELDNSEEIDFVRSLKQF